MRPMWWGHSAMISAVGLSGPGTRSQPVRLVGGGCGWRQLPGSTFGGVQPVAGRRLQTCGRACARARGPRSSAGVRPQRKGRDRHNGGPIPPKAGLLARGQDFSLRGSKETQRLPRQTQAGLLSYFIHQDRCQALVCPGSWAGEDHAHGRLRIHWKRSPRLPYQDQETRKRS
jgi:hypothetical protein